MTRLRSLIAGLGCAGLVALAPPPGVAAPPGVHFSALLCERASGEVDFLTLLC